MLVDQQQKWQRITEWISHDSAEAAAFNRPSSSSRGASVSTRATAGSSNGPAGDDALNAQHGPGLGPGCDTIEGFADLRYSLDTTLVDPEQHAVAQAAAAAAAARQSRTAQTAAAAPRLQQVTYMGYRM